MNSRKLLVYLLFIAFLIHVRVCCDKGATVLGEDLMSLPREVASVLNANSDTIRDVSLVLRRTRSTTLSLETLLKSIDCQYEYGFLEQSDHVYMWHAPCFYYSCSGSFAVVPNDMNKLPFAYDKNLEYSTTISEFSFDEKEFMYGGGHEWTEHVSPALSIDPKDQAIRDIGNGILFDFGYLLAAGYRFPVIGKDIGTSQESYVMYLLQNGQIDGIERILSNGDEYFIVSIIARDTHVDDDRLYTFWLMPKYQYASEKMMARTKDGRIIYEIENSNFTKIGKGNVYFPRISKITYYSWHTKPDFISDSALFAEEYTLVDVSVARIARNQFDLRKKYSGTGTTIADRTLRDTPSGLQYIVPANPADLDRVIEAALTGKDFVPTPIRPSLVALLFRWSLAIVGLCMIFYALFRMFTRST